MSEKLFTIGFTKKTAEDFFRRISESGTTKVIDVRLNNSSQLAGFAKRRDLEFFLDSICSVNYMYTPELAPTKSILDAYKKFGGEWDIYEAEFNELMEKRMVEKAFSKSDLDGGCFLCSEDKPHHCHRRLVAEYLSKKWQEDLEIVHL